MGKHRKVNPSRSYEQPSNFKAAVKWIKSHKLSLTIFTILVGLTSVATVLGFQAIKVKNELTVAQTSLQTLLDEAKAGQFENYSQRLEAVSKSLSEASEITSAPLWKIGELVPVAGENLKAVSLLGDLGLKVTEDLLLPLEPVVAKPGGPSLQDAPTITDLLVPVFDQIKADADSVSELNVGFLIPQISSPVEKFQTAYLPIKPQMEEIGKLLPSVPDILGMNGPRNYLLLFKTNSELTTQGGFALQKSVISLVDGAPGLSELTDGHDFRWLDNPVSITQETNDFFGEGADRDIAAFTQFFNFSETAAAAAQGYEAQTGVHLDGVISMDPVALGYLLEGAQEIKLTTGDSINSTNAASLLLHDIYLRFPDDETDAGTNAFFAEAIGKIKESFLSQPIDPVKLFSGLSKSLSERRVQMWGVDEKLQVLFSKVGATGDLPVDNAEKIVFGSFITDRSFGTKMNYFVQAQTEIKVNKCLDQSLTHYFVTTRLTNTVNAESASGFPRYVLAQAGSGFYPGEFGITSRTVGPVGATVVSMSINDSGEQQDEMIPRTYLNRPLGEVNLRLMPGQSATINVDFTLPNSSSVAPVSIFSTPLAQTMETKILEENCAG